jgi:hypothetical protein
MKILPLIIISAAILISCEKKQTNMAENQKNADSDSVKVEDRNNKTSSAETVEVIPANAVAANPNEPQTAKSTAKPALNPAHGEPFHRCDIAVGAPIDSAPQQNAAPVSAPQMQSNNSSFNTNPISPSIAAPVSAPQSLGPKPALNPAHGQPHHRCDLEVGAPLT